MCVSVCEVEANTGASATCQTVDSGSKLLQRSTGLNLSALFFCCALHSLTEKYAQSMEMQNRKLEYQCKCSSI